jgi:hypothetical protein
MEANTKGKPMKHTNQEAWKYSYAVDGKPASEAATKQQLSKHSSDIKPAWRHLRSEA